METKEVKVVNVWKVPALKTRAFKEWMRSKKLRMDSPATILNICAGFNFFYETTDSYGDVTEDTAYRISASNVIEVKTY